MVVCGHDPERTKVARAFATFVNSLEGRPIMRRYGLLLPGETWTRSSVPPAPKEPPRGR